MRWVVIIFLSCACFASYGRPAGDCPELKVSDFPKKDLPPAGFTPAKLKVRTSYSYYYGLGVAKNYKLARYLAFLEMEKGDGNTPFAGASILLMLYANGYGVNRDLDLCMRLACGNVGFSQAEIDGRHIHLEKMQERQDTTVFDLCDDITSGYMAGFCQSIKTERLMYQRDSAMKSELKTWSHADAVAFNKLKIVAFSYFDLEVTDETDQSGTARVALALQAHDAFEDGFLQKMITIAHCSGKDYSAGDFVKADNELNDIYRKLMNAKPGVWGTVTKDGIKETQRSWLAYRDAWISFIKVKCPQLSPAAWKTMLTKERSEILEQFVDQ